jgi:hypothetical protein
MGGGTSRLDVTDWEAADGGCRPPPVEEQDEDGGGGEVGNVVRPEMTVAADTCKPFGDARNRYTVDGAPPTRHYQTYELQKQTVGQRAFDVVDGDQNVVLTTMPVAGTLAWFDVCGPASLGEYIDYRLRVQAEDHFRRTWIVYRYHEQCWEGQRPADPAQFEGKIPENCKLYKSACITVSWSRYVAVSARYGPPGVQDFLDMQDTDEGSASKEIGLPRSSSNLSDDEPLFSVASQIAARSREKHEHEKEEEQASKNQNDEEKNNQITGNQNGDNEDNCKVPSADEAVNGDDRKFANDSAGDETRPKKSAPAVKPTPQKVNAEENCDQYEAIISPPASFDNTEPSCQDETLSTAAMNTSKTSKRRTGKLPATTLTQLAASHSTNSLASSALRKTSAKTQKLRQYFSSKRSPASTPTSTSRFGSKFFARKIASDDASDDDNKSVDGDETGNNDTIVSAAASDIGTTEDDAAPQQTPKELYELAMEGVIDLDTQPIVQCQEIYNKMLGNHQTMILTKEELFALLRLDEAQHKKQLEQEAAQGINTTNGHSIDDHANPIEDDMELDETCKIHQKENGTVSGFMSRISSLRARSTKTADSSASDYIAGGSGKTSDTAEISKVRMEDDPPVPSLSSPDGQRMRSSWGRLFNGSTAVSTNTTSGNGQDDSKQKATGTEHAIVSEQSTLLKNASTAFSARETMPNILDDAMSNSSSRHLDTNEQQCNDMNERNSAISDMGDSHQSPMKPQSPAPAGVEKSKEEAQDESKFVNTTDRDLDNKESVQNAGDTKAFDDINDQTLPSMDGNPNPLVGYWFWKHTTFNFQQHKMHMHLAKNSDLALHVILAIIVNQVRSERNHTFFATTGLHPAWFFIDPRNPKAMFQ